LIVVLLLFSNNQVCYGFSFLQNDLAVPLLSLTFEGRHEGHTLNREDLLFDLLCQRAQHIAQKFL